MELTKEQKERFLSYIMKEIPKNDEQVDGYLFHYEGARGQGRGGETYDDLVQAYIEYASRLEVVEV